MSSDEEKIARTMGDVIKDYNIEELIGYLQRRDLKLDDDFAILHKQKVAGSDFLELTEKNYVVLVLYLVQQVD